MAFQPAIRKLLSYLKQQATVWAGRSHQRENRLFRTPPHFTPAAGKVCFFHLKKRLVKQFLVVFSTF